MTDWLCVRVCVCLRVVGRFWRRRRNGLWVHKCVYVAGCYVVNRSARYSNPLDVCVRLPITKQEELTDLRKEGNCSYTATIWQTSNRTGQGVYSWKLINCWRTAVFMSCPVGAYNCTHTFLTTNAQNVGLWLLCFWLLFCLGTWSTLQNSLQSISLPEQQKSGYSLRTSIMLPSCAIRIIVNMSLLVGKLDMNVVFSSCILLGNW